jgi:hypothetical protein
MLKSLSLVEVAVEQAVQVLEMQAVAVAVVAITTMLLNFFLQVL